ncbi:MAG: hypothetical protein JW816_03720 [Candidatus Buchananbacteria bacterium]|nr:hypothetical protein [Candidatus Buchananbacteria bacterium]
MNWEDNHQDRDIAIICGALTLIAMVAVISSVVDVDWKQITNYLPTASFAFLLIIMSTQTYRLRKAAEDGLPQKSGLVYLLLSTALSIGSISWADHSSPGCWITLSCVWSGIVLLLLIYYFGRHGEVKYIPHKSTEVGEESRADRPGRPDNHAP